MKEYQSLSHTRWDCKYHVVWLPALPLEFVEGALIEALEQLADGGIELGE